jgi:glucokinase
MAGVTDVVLAVDAGGTKCLGGLVGRSGEVLDVHELPTPRVDGRGDPGLTTLAALTSTLRDRAVATGRRARAVGVGVPEYVRDGRLTSAEVLAWDTQPADLLAAVCPGLPLVVEADVRCAAYAEASTRWRASRTILYVSWGTGLSSTLVVDGRCLPGRRGEALAFGELGVAPAVDQAWDGNLEDFASGLGVGARYTALTGVPAGGREVAVRAADGDALAQQVLESAARAVAYALRDCTALLDPDAIVLGGGIGSGGGLLPHAVIDVFATLATRPAPPPVAVAQLGPRAGLVGAGLLAWAAAD